MSETAPGVVAARIEVERARARLKATAEELHLRLKPDTLVRQGVDKLCVRGGEVADEVIDVVQARPGLIGGTVAAMLLLWLRRPIARLGRRLFFRKDETVSAAGRLRDVTKN